MSEISSILHSELKALLAKWLAESTKEIEILVKLREAAKIIKNDKLQSEIEWRESRCLRQQDCYQDLSRLLRQYLNPGRVTKTPERMDKIIQCGDEVVQCSLCKSNNLTITMFGGLKCRECGTEFAFKPVNRIPSGGEKEVTADDLLRKAAHLFQ